MYILKWIELKMYKVYWYICMYNIILNDKISYYLITTFATSIAINNKNTYIYTTENKHYQTVHVETTIPLPLIYGNLIYFDFLCIFINADSFHI